MESLRGARTRGLWVQHGRLLADGPIDAVIDEYLASDRRHTAAASA